MTEIEYMVTKAFNEACETLQDDKIWIDTTVETEERHMLEDGREVRVFVKVTTELDEF